MFFPWRSSARARLRTSNAVSVPSRDMRSANRSSNWTVRGIRQNLILYYRGTSLNHPGVACSVRTTHRALLWQHAWIDSCTPRLVPLAKILLKKPCLVSAKGRRLATCLDVQEAAGWFESHIGWVNVVSCIGRQDILSVRQISNVNLSAGHLRGGYVDGNAFASLEDIISRTSRWRNPRTKPHREALGSAVFVN